MIGEYILIFSIIFAVSYFIVERWKGARKSKHRHPPSLPSLPLIGSFPFLRNFQNIAEFFLEKSLQLGPMFVFRVGNKLVLTLNNKEVIEEAFVKKSRTFSSRPDLYIQKLTNPSNKGISFMDTTPEWRRYHQLSMSILKEFGFGDKNVLEERIQTEVEAMIDYARNKNGKAFEPKELSLLMSSNVMMSIIFGSRRSYGLGISDLIQAVDRFEHCLGVTFDVAPFLKFIPRFRKIISEMKICSKKMHDIIEMEIDRSLQSREKCFVYEYITREGPNYDRDQLKFVARDLVAAGTDTTANTFLWLLVALANHPEIQRRLQKDIDSVISRDRLPMLGDQPRLPYVEATILELYRWRTLSSLSARYTKHDSIFRDYFIPAGTLVMPNFYAVHSSPMVWKDPDVFRPERFLDKDENVVGKDRIIPFSLGRRSCLGEILARAEIFLTLTSLLQKFTVLAPEGQDKVCEKPLLPITLLTVPTAFSIRLIERQ